MRTKQQTITSAAGGKTVIDAERICHREFLTPVRAFYLDLAQWAVDDPGRWGRWAAPCPVGRAETIQGKVQRHRKSRMDARTRERLPVLPVLARSAARQHADAAALLQAARDTRPGHIITSPSPAQVRFVTKTTAASVWASDPATGKRRNLTAEEDRAFWAWATVEVLRATGIRVEELVQLSHHSFVQYRLPSTGELVPSPAVASPAAWWTAARWSRYDGATGLSCGSRACEWDTSISACCGSSAPSSTSAASLGR
jgi:hypothetical protein